MNGVKPYRLLGRAHTMHKISKDLKLVLFLFVWIEEEMQLHSGGPTFSVRHPINTFV